MMGGLIGGEYEYQKYKNGSRELKRIKYETSKIKNISDELDKNNRFLKEDLSRKIEELKIRLRKEMQNLLDKINSLQDDVRLYQINEPC